MAARKLPDHQTFTRTYSGISPCLNSNVKLISGDEKIDGIALWDTGATNTCISKDVAEKLNLVATGKTYLKTPSGSDERNTYLLTIELPNNVVVVDVKVTETEIGEQGLDLLIGMDIISKGDFAVSNFEGKTCFSFRVPSICHADYVHEAKVSKAIGQIHGKGKRKRKK